MSTREEALAEELALAIHTLSHLMESVDKPQRRIISQRIERFRRALEGMESQGERIEGKVLLDDNDGSEYGTWLFRADDPSTSDRPEDEPLWLRATLVLAHPVEKEEG